MKLHTKLNGICAAIALTAASAASATPFYLDIGADFEANATRELTKVCPTCTSKKNEFQYAYDSNTKLFDTDASGTISLGDLVTTNIGLSVGGWDTNFITNLLPGGSQSNNGLGSDYQISMNVVGLGGMVTTLSGAGVPGLSYGPGLLKLFLSFDDGATSTNFMNLKIAGGAPTGISTVLFGKVDFTGVDPSFYNNLFHSFGPSGCGGLTGFFDIWTACGPTATDELAINFNASQDTNVLLSDFQPRPYGFEITSNHDGSGNFNIPEPSALLLMGAAMLGFGASKRRAKQG